MTNLPLPPPGLIGLTQISGGVGKLIEIGQYLNGDGFKAWEHAFMTLPGGMILEAEPGGAKIVPTHYTRVYWCNNLHKLLPATVSPDDIMRVALELKGIPYSFLDYGALVAHRLHIPAPHLRKFIASTGHMICSQMDDEFYARLGAHIFTDNRWPGFVDPLSLYNRDRELALR